MNTRFVVEIDPEAEFEECNGESRPLTEAEYAENQYMRDGQPIPYGEYLRYYGNPDRHVYLMVTREDRCSDCGTWVAGESLGFIDCMDDQPEAQSHGKYALDALPGYLKEIARELSGYRDVR